MAESRVSQLTSLPLAAAGTLARAVRREARRLPLLGPSLEQAVGERVVLVTGASSGIGRATAFKIGLAGGIVLLVARRAEKLEEARREIERAGGVAHVHPCDLTDEADIDRITTRCSTATAGSMCSSTTRGTRSADRWSARMTGCTTTGGRWSSTISVR